MDTIGFGGLLSEKIELENTTAFMKTAEITNFL
jgi:hypothetical protein